MEKLFMMALDYAVESGNLERVHYYGKNYASVEFIKDTKKYSLAISCEDIKEEVNDGN